MLGQVEGIIILIITLTVLAIGARRLGIFRLREEGREKVSESAR